MLAIRRDRLISFFIFKR